MKRTDNMHFLLGGHDLEMLAIRDLLESNRIPYTDLQLRWDNALLSKYADTLDTLSPTHTIYGIELREDIPLPANYHTIDHHNRQSHLPSALEQVASLLQIPMNRMMQLIAMNDKAYIPGLEEFGATKEEIEKIRYADRNAQGVTETDELLAEKAITENLTRKGGIIVIKALSSRFSPICDRLYPYKKLLIYTDDEWIYYGKDADRIPELLPEEESAGKLFHGGGPDGYIGMKYHTCSPEEITRIIETITTGRHGE